MPCTDWIPTPHRHTPGKHRSCPALRCLLALALVFCGWLPLGAQSQPAVAINLLYATNRVSLDHDRKEAHFDNVPGALTVGTATVVVEPDIESDTGSWPTVRNAALEPGWVALEPFPQNDLAELADALALERTDRTALVYVHGFMKSFEAAARDLAGIVYGAGYQGVPIVFSWPAGSSPLGYADDTLSMNRSIPSLSAVLAALSTTEHIEKIHLVAHSMGNQALLAVLTQMIRSDQAAHWKRGELILYAPDVDRATFMTETLPLLRESDFRPTLYVAAFDVPLMSSRVVNNGPRLGDADAGIAVDPGMDTVDATPVAKFLDRHNHHLTRGSQADVGKLLEGIEPADRTTLRARDNGSGRYWEIIGGEENAQ